MRNIVNNKLLGIYNIIFGLLLGIGSSTIFSSCDTTEKIMKCFWSVRAEIGISILLIFVGLLFLILKSQDNYFVLSIISAALGIIAILTPSVLIGGCQSHMMRCRSITFPMIYLISTIAICLSIISAIFFEKTIHNLKKTEF